MRNRINLLAATGVSVAAAVVLLVIVIPREQRSQYINSIEEHRRGIDAFMSRSADSPIPRAFAADFNGLVYYPVNRDYRVLARIERIDEEPVFGVATSGGTEELYERYAWATFNLHGSDHRVLLLRAIDATPSNRLFFAFTDSTGGAETYSGGRYINLYQENKGTIVIDFNKAYNPYCVYDVAYICPIPPWENALRIPIEAGEKMYRFDRE